jgi:hypothetical protein
VAADWWGCRHAKKSWTESAGAPTGTSKPGQPAVGRSCVGTCTPWPPAHYLAQVHMGLLAIAAASTCVYKNHVLWPGTRLCGRPHPTTQNAHGQPVTGGGKDSIMVRQAAAAAIQWGWTQSGPVHTQHRKLARAAQHGCTANQATNGSPVLGDAYTQHTPNTKAGTWPRHQPWTGWLHRFGPFQGRAGCTSCASWLPNGLPTQ